MRKCRKFWSIAGLYRNQILAVIIPVLLLPLHIVVNDKRATCGYVVLVMALFWLTQLVPLSVTGLLPFIFFPMLGIMTAVDIATEFFNEFYITLIAGFVLANAMEETGLHKRFALSILKLTGSKQHFVLLGLMIPTFVISMWINNLAVCVLMVAIADEIVKQLEKQANDNLLENPGKVHNVNNRSWKNNADKNPSHYSNYGNSDISLVSIRTTSYKESDHSNECRSDDTVDIELFQKGQECETEATKEENRIPNLDLTETTLDSGQRRAMESWFKNIRACYTLGISFTSKIGGACTMMGTSNNLLAKELTDNIWQQNGFVSSPINFTSWLIVNLPIGIIVFFVIWGWFCLLFLVWGGCSLEPGAREFASMESDQVRQYIQRELDKLGKLRYIEYFVIVMLICTISLWFFLEPDFMPGWGSSFKQGYLTMAVPAAMVIVVFALTPSEFPCKAHKGVKTVKTIGNIPALWRSFPWGVTMMVGGGTALAQGMRTTGLSDWIADGLTALQVIPGVGLMLVLALMVTFFTEIIADAVTINIFVPIAGRLAESMGKNPLYLILPVSLAATYSFVLPIAGAVNAWILTSTGNATVKDSVKAGILINIVCVLVVVLGMHTWADAYLDLDTIPWANSTNIYENTTAIVNH